MKTEFAHDILQSCEKLNHIRNSQKQCFIHLCVHSCLCSKTQLPQYQPRSLCATMKDCTCESKVRSLLRLEKNVPMCILSVSSAFGVHADISWYTPTCTWHQNMCVRIITTSETDTKDNACLTEEHGANKALTYTDLEPHKETDWSLQSPPSAFPCCHSQKMSRDIPCSPCCCSPDTDISTVPTWSEPTKSCHFAKSLPICLVFKN